MKKNRRGELLTLFIIVVILLTCISCEKGAVTANPPAAGDDGVALTASTLKPVAKIVFVGMEECCKCTRERTARSWGALQAALKGKFASAPVARVHVDTQADQAAKYKAMKPMVAIPALYFLDADGNLLDLLQGEVTQAQVEKLL